MRYIKLNEQEFKIINMAIECLIVSLEQGEQWKTGSFDMRKLQDKILESKRK